MGDYNDGLLPEPCLRLDFGFGQQYASIELGDGSGYVRVAENAKLREFASELLVGVCDACAFPPCDECEVYATARELGIEVGKP